MTMGRLCLIYKLFVLYSYNVQNYKRAVLWSKVLIVKNNIVHIPIVAVQGLLFMQSVLRFVYIFYILQHVGCMYLLCFKICWLHDIFYSKSGFCLDLCCISMNIVGFIRYYGERWVLSVLLDVFIYTLQDVIYCMSNIVLGFSTFYCLLILFSFAPYVFVVYSMCIGYDCRGSNIVLLLNLVSKCLLLISVPAKFCKPISLHSLPGYAAYHRYNLD